MFENLIAFLRTACTDMYAVVAAVLSGKWMDLRLRERGLALFAVCIALMLILVHLLKWALTPLPSVRDVYGGPGWVVDKTLTS